MGSKKRRSAWYAIWSAMTFNCKIIGFPDNYSKMRIWVTHKKIGEDLYRLVSDDNSNEYEIVSIPFYHQRTYIKIFKSFFKKWFYNRVWNIIKSEKKLRLVKKFLNTPIELHDNK